MTSIAADLGAALRMSGHIYVRRLWHFLRDLRGREIDLFATDPDFAEPFSEAERAAASAIETICLPLGPYRNLTTVTAAIFALHRDAFVLNHSGVRIFRDPSLDIFSSEGRRNWHRFALAAVRMAKIGRRGNHGGSVLHSHAFDRGALREVYAARFGEEIVPARPRTLFWKESMVLANRLRQSGFDFARAESFPVAMKFVIPMRNPIDCAQSSMRTGHYVYLSRGPLTGKMAIVRRIIDFYAYIARHIEEGPDRFFILHEYDLDRDTLAALQAFANLPEDPDWIDAVLKVIAFDKRYRHTKAEWTTFERLVREEVGAETRVGRNLLRFCRQADPPGGTGSSASASAG